MGDRFQPRASPWDSGKRDTQFVIGRAKVQRGGLIPDVAFVIRHLVLFQYLPVFVLERYLAMMFALILDVPAYAGDLGFGDGEGAGSRIARHSRRIRRPGS